ncbi:MAG: hypothetical protein QXQ81_04435 [Candidatus Thorarchaeota archaeon]
MTFASPILYGLPIPVVISLLSGKRHSSRTETTLKEALKILNQIKRGKTPSVPQFPSRRDLYMSLFLSRMAEAGITPSTSVGAGLAVPVTKLAEYLRSIGIEPSVIEALETGVEEATSEDEVDIIVEASSGTASLQLTEEQVKTVKGLARESWKRSHGGSGG